MIACDAVQRAAQRQQAAQRCCLGLLEQAAGQIRYDSVVIVQQPQPVADEYSLSREGVLRVRGHAGPPPPDFEGLLCRQGATEVHVVPVRLTGDEFSVEIPAASMPAFGATLPLRDGVWSLKLRPTGQPGAQPVQLTWDPGRLGQFRKRSARLGRKTFVLTAAKDSTVTLTVGPDLGLADGGRVRRKALRDVYYPLLQRRPVRDSVVFVSFKGKSCSDNPLGISQELRRRGDDREHIWAIGDWSVPVPDGARPVLMWTEAFWDVLARSSYIISNDELPARFSKRPGQLYVQTWHGTLLKRIGFDVEDLKIPEAKKYNEVLAQEVAKWDLALSPNPFSTPLMRRAFRYDGQICESGYPRNDVLSRGDTAALAGQVRERLGLPAGKKVVLYAPTWRDNQYYASGRYRFDLRLDLQDAHRRLGEDYVFLIRGHHQAADDVPAELAPGFAVNVTMYPDVCELLLVADVLITDYSSMMCDFAATGKPMVFYTYDLEEYRDNLRGFNLDLEAEAPGPLLATSAEVIQAVADLDAVTARHRARYEAFAAKFCALDDGKAGARACDAIFGA
jgi:CDP-glycerol glycerophosphotransferase